MVQHKEPNAHDKQLVVLGRTLQTLREEADAEVLIDAVIKYLQVAFDYSLIWIGLYDRVDHSILGKGGVTPTGDISFLKQRFNLSPGDLLEQVVIQQRPVAVPDLRAELRLGEWRKVAANSNIQGTVIFPIRYQDCCYGMTLLGSNLWGISPQVDEKARLSMVLGQLGASLNQIEANWKQQQTKRPEQTLLSLLNRLRSVSGLGVRLEAVVEETHQFIQPTRTNIYWFERERRYFWRRVSNQQRSTGFNSTNQPSSGITAQEVSAFYQALIADQVVSIGEAHSSLKADTTSRLMQLIRARSLLAAPILYQDELLGFLSVEGNEARIWTEEEKNLVRGASQLIALSAPLHEMEDKIKQISSDRTLTAEIARSIYSDEDWKSTLKMSADQICQRLHADRFLVLQYNEDADTFEICYQTQPANRRPLSPVLQSLNQSDVSALEKSPEAISIENLDGDVRFATWQPRLLELGVRSLILCNTSMGHKLEGLVVICHEAARTWNRTERELVQVVSQQIGVILHQWQLRNQNEQQQTINQTIQWGVTTLQQTHKLELLERFALEHLSQALQVPLAAMVTWLPGRRGGRLFALPANERFVLNSNNVIPIGTDPLVQWALNSHEPLCCAIEDIPPETRQWLNSAAIGQVLITALRTDPEHEPTSILVLGDTADRRWSAQHLNVLATLASQIAWFRRYLTITEMLSFQRDDLQRLNWYKHRSIEEAHRSLTASLKRLSELGGPKDPLLNTRQQQLIRQMSDALLPIAQMLQEEQWQLRIRSSTTALISLLKRSLARVEESMKQKQLWSQVHDETNLTISGDIAKIELILYELLLTACERSGAGGRIDIWCRQVDNRWFELSITDNGQLEPRTLVELESGRGDDPMAPSTLDASPGLHLLICRTLMKQIGGEFNLYKLEDGRILSRVVLPIAHHLSAPNQT